MIMDVTTQQGIIEVLNAFDKCSNPVNGDVLLIGAGTGSQAIRVPWTVFCAYFGSMFTIDKDAGTLTYYDKDGNKQTMSVLMDWSTLGDAAKTTIINSVTADANVTDAARTQADTSARAEADTLLSAMSVSADVDTGTVTFTY
jgi:hypothetical protein